MQTNYQFTAIPVGKGDSFLLSSGQMNVLVDGGIGKSFIRSYLEGKQINRLDVMICTHNDKDHTNGLQGLLESALDIGELWLPGSWLSALDGIRSYGRHWIAGVIDEGYDAGAQNYNSLEELNDSLHLHENDSTEDQSTPVDEVLYSLFDFDDGSMEPTTPIIWGPVPHVYKLPEAIFATLDAAKRILELARAAWNRGIPIHWFKYSNTSSIHVPSGPLPCLIPLNSHEVMTIRRSSRVFYSLALTESNKESLVFLARLPEQLGVLFSADSDFSFIPTGQSLVLPTIRDAIVTVPHHGSHHNQMAYGIIKSGFGETHLSWVRSDSKNQNRPCPSYLNIPKRDRFCTLCKGSALPKSQVTAVGTGTGWTFQNAPCQCV